MVTNAERWRTVAAQFEEAAITGRVTDATRYGLCDAVGYGCQEYRALYCVRWDALSGRDPSGTFLGPTYPEPGWRNMARIRATLALLMAHMAEDDGGNHRNEEEPS